MGGSNDASVFNDVWTTMDHGGSWLRVVKVAPWAPRASHGAAVLEVGGARRSPARRSCQRAAQGSNSLLIMGGHDPQARTVFNDVWRSIDGGRRWALVAEAAPWPARFAFASVVIGVRRPVAGARTHSSTHACATRTERNGAGHGRMRFRADRRGVQ